MAHLRTALVLTTLLAATGCASMRDGSLATAAPAAADSGAVDPAVLYMQRVEQQARLRGIGVTWINPPHRRARPAPVPR